MARADEAAFMDSMEAAIDKYVKQQARNTIALNAERDPACAGYARVPGPDACDFCITMGAANDFYHTRETAGGGAGHGTADDRYHPYCNCGVCLIFRRDGRLVARDPDTGEVVDYDGADMIRRYNEAGRPTFAKNRERENANRRGGRHGAGRLSWKQAAEHADRLEAAASAEELRAIAAEVERAVPKAAKSSAQWKNLQAIAQRRMRELRESLPKRREDIPIFGSFGSDYYFARVMDTDGSLVEMKVGTSVTDVEEFAGAGFSRKIDEVDKLIKRHGGSRDDWVKVKGIGKIEHEGIEISVEMHWYEMVDSPVPYDRKIVRYIL